MLSSMAYVQVVVSDTQKSRWAEYVEDDPAVDSVSDLIRTAVEEFIARDTDRGPSELNTPVVDGELDEVQSRLANVEDQLDLLRLENVEEDQLEEIVQYIVEDELIMHLDRLLEEIDHNDPREFK